MERDSKEHEQSGGWYAFDLDNSIAQYYGYEGPTDIGEPLGIDDVHSTFNTLLQYLESGKDCRIFTARADNPYSVRAINAWSKKYLGRIIPVTNIKDHNLIHGFDDRFTGVDPDTGVPWKKEKSLETLPNTSSIARTLPDQERLCRQ
jgi:hypothetical protein